MNRIYKTVWSVAQRCMVVVSELAKNGAGTVAKSIVLLVIMASQATDTYAINNNLSFVGVQGPAAGNANNYCMNDGVTRLLCAPWSSTVTAVTGDNFGYMSGINSNNTGISWAGTSSAGLSFGGISNTYVAGSSQVILQQSGISLNSDAITLNGTSATINTTNGLSLSGKKITSLAAGAANTDAVNISQLSSVLSALGGSGASINSTTGAITTPTYTLSTKPYTTVGAALTALDSGAAGLVQQSAAGAPITVGAATNGTQVNFTGTAGARTLTGVANGTVASGSTQAVNGGQLYTGNQNLAAYLGGGAAVSTTDGSVTAPSYALTGLSGTPFNNVGSALTALNTGLGATNTSITNLTNQGTKYFHANSTGADSVASGTDAVAIGTGASAANKNDVALGAGSVTATAVQTSSAPIAGVTYTFAGGAPTSTVSIGAAGSERTLTNVAAGQLSSTSTDAVNGSQLFASNQAINSLSTNLNSGGIGLVRQSAAGAPITVGAATNGTQVDFTGTGGARTLIGVANGTVASGSTQAVNGGQLYAGNQNLATYLGGGAGVNASNGSVTAPSYALTGLSGTPFNNVGSALTALNTGLGATNTSITNLTNQGTKYFHANSTGADSTASGADAVAIGTGASAANKNDVALGAGSVTATAVQTSSAPIAGVTYTFAGGSPTSTVSIGAAGSERTLTNVAAGQLSATSTDAVNGSQLFASNEAIDSLSTTISSGGIGLVRQSAAGAPITVGAATNGTQVDFTGTGGARTLIGVANGTVASGSTQAVNGGQLYAGNQNLATYLGGGAGVNASNGAVTAPLYTLTGLSGTPFNNVGSALTALNSGLGATNTSITNLTNQGTKYFHANSTGADSAATGADAVAVGTGASASARDAIAIGNVASAGNAGDVALGANSVTAAAVATPSATIAGTVYHFAGDAPASTVSIGAVDSERTLTNVAAGQLSATSTDAVNGSQLFASNEAIDTLSTTISAGGIGLVRQSAAGAPITVGAATDGSQVDFTGTAGARTLTGVANGTVASGSSDAVNGSQLFDTNNAITNLTNQGTKYFHANSTGADSSATGADAVAVGTGASASARDAIAIGNVASAGNAGDVALGANSVTAAAVATPSATIAGTVYHFAGDAPASTVSIGAVDSERTLTNVAAGQLSATSTDAVNGSQLFASNQAIDTLSTTISAGGIGLVQQSAAGAPITVGAATDGTQVNFTGTAGARTLTGVANGTVASGSSDAVNGSQLFDTNNAITNLTNQGTKYFHANSTGADSAATGADAVAIGTGASASSADAVAIGNVASAGNAGDVALGANSVTAAAVATPSATIAGTVYHFAGDAPASTVSIGAVDSERTLTNVAAGQLSATSTDAVNGSQLFASNEAIDTLSTTINSGGIGLVRQSAAGAPITVGAATDGSQVNFTGTAGARTLTGVANGTVASGSTQAVNGGQLYAGNQNLAAYLGGGAAVSTTDGSVTAPSYALTGLSGTPFNNVGSALTALNSGLGATNTSITNLTNQGTKYFHANSTGADSAATGADAVAVGTGASASARDAIAIGNVASAGNAGDVALGANSVTAAAVATPSATIAGTVYHFAGDAPASTVSIGAVDSERTLTNVAAGQLSATSTDAVNGSQLFASNEAIDTLSTTINSGGIGLVRQSAAGAPITVGAATDGSQVDFTGTGGARTLTGVANGTVASGSTQAVNGGQLYTGNQNLAAYLGGGAAVSATDGSVTAPSYALTGLSGTPFNNVGSALTALNSGLGTTNSNVTSLGNTVNNLTTKGTNYFHANSTGADSAATGADAVAVGTGASASSADAVAIGNSASAGNAGDVALGANSVTAAAVATPSATIAGTVYHFAGDAPASTVSIGAVDSERTLTNVAAGQLSATSTDAVNGSQLFASNEAIDTLSTTINSGGIGLVRQSAAGAPITVGAATDGTQVDFTGTAGARTLTGVANGTVASGSSDAVNGSQLFDTNNAITNLTNQGTKYFHANSTGADSAATGTDAVAIGTAATAGNAGDVALGANSVTAVAVATPSASIAGTTYHFAGNAPTSTVSIGAPGSERTLTNVAAGQLSATSTDAVNGSQLFASNAAIDTLSSALNSSGIGLVQQDSTTHEITVGKNTDGTDVSFAAAGGASRTLSGVANGSVAVGSTQAINGSQLYSANQNIASALGGGATVGSNGNLTNPSYNIQGSIKTNVGDALGALDTATTSNTNNIVNLANNINSGSIGLVQQASGTSDVTVAAATGGNAVSFAGTSGNRILTGVAAGALSAGSTEAVNGSQLFAVDQQVIQNTSNIVDLYQNINNSGQKLVTQATTSSEVDIAQGTGGSTVNIASDEGTRVLTGLSAGVNDSDAVTVGQIKALELQQGNTKQLAVNATGIATASGSNAAAVGSNARSTGVNSTTLGNDTFASGANSTVVGNGAVASGDNSVAMGAFSSATASNSVALGANSIASEANTVSVGSPGNERRITNVAPGVNDTDAVNVYQLDQVQAANNQSFRNINNLVDRLDNKLTAGVASAMAMAGLPQAWEPSSSLVGVSVAGYDDKASLAIGVSAISGNGKWITKLQGSGNSESDFGVSVGIGYQW